MENYLAIIQARTFINKQDIQPSCPSLEVLVVGTPQMREKVYIPSITVKGVPILNEPELWLLIYCLHMYHKLSSLQIITLETLEK